MKTLKKGKIPEPKTYKVGCSNCKTIFEFTEKEASWSPDPRERCLIIQCPLCGNDVYKEV